MKNFTNNAILYTKDNYDLLNKIKNICKNTNLNLFCEIDFFNLVQKIVKAYEVYENRENAREKHRSNKRTDY